MEDRKDKPKRSNDEYVFNGIDVNIRQTNSVGQNAQVYFSRSIDAFTGQIPENKTQETPSHVTVSVQNANVQMNMENCTGANTQTAFAITITNVFLSHTESSNAQLPQITLDNRSSEPSASSTLDSDSSVTMSQSNRSDTSHNSEHLRESHRPILTGNTSSKKSTTRKKLDPPTSARYKPRRWASSKFCSSSQVPTHVLETKTSVISTSSDTARVQNSSSVSDENIEKITLTALEKLMLQDKYRKKEEVGYTIKEIARSLPENSDMDASNFIAKLTVALRKLVQNGDVERLRMGLCYVYKPLRYHQR